MTEEDSDDKMGVMMCSGCGVWIEEMVEGHQYVDDTTLYCDVANDEVGIVRESTVRAKWTIDGAETLSEAAEQLESKADWLREIQEDGWRLREEIYDDYGFIVKDVDNDDK